MKVVNRVFALTALTVGMAGSAQAQVSGIASTDPARVIAASQAYNSARQQITTQYQSYLDQIETKNQQISTLSKQLDTNGDNQVTEAELEAAQRANSPTLQQIQTETNSMNQLQAPIVKAQMYALEQIANEYNNAQQKVVSDRKISVILSPDAFLYAPPQVDVTQQLVEALNGRISSVNITAPADWQPLRTTVALHQQVQGILAAAVRAQAARNAQSGAQPQNPAPSGR